MEEGKLPILIVDDEELIRDILSRKLELDGYNCEVAADGQEALYKASMKNFDLVLLDVSMPGLSGIEVLRRLTADHANIWVIMITGTADTKTHIEALKLGACDYVAKPFDLDDVSARVKRALEIRRLVLKKTGRQLAPGENEALRSLLCGQVSLDELRTVHQTRGRESTPGAEFAIPVFGAATDPRELARYMQIARKLLQTTEILHASIRDDGEWASLLSKDTANQFGCYDDLIGMTNGLHIAGPSLADGKIHIPDHSFIESISWAHGEDGGMREQLASTDIIMSQLERLRDIMLTTRVPDKRQREPGYHSNATRHPYQFQPGNREIVEALVNLSRGQRDSCAMDYLLQILQQQMMTLQGSASVQTLRLS
jgi:DNA-binding response OmpR family regulator